MKNEINKMIRKHLTRLDGLIVVFLSMYLIYLIR